ncbi:hypothetical protein BGW42_001317 [Actinomortierella wolfii]|nr:hypothetical protein BGW42_001317 [Actinomortierella wolfii]
MSSTTSSSPTRTKGDTPGNAELKQDDPPLYDPKSLQATIDMQSLYQVIALSRICDELTVYCPHKSLGCPYTCPRHAIGKHLKDDCNYIGTMCRNEECRKKLLKKDLSEHMETCPYKRVECLMCHSKVQRSQLSEHHKSCPAESVTCPHCNTTRTRLRHLEHMETCPQQLIGCTHSEFGCPWQGARFELQALHIPQCPYEAIRGFLELHKTKTEALEQENQRLRSLYYDLRPQVQQLREQVSGLAESVQLLTGASQERGGDGGQSMTFGFQDTSQLPYTATQQHRPQYNHHPLGIEPLENSHHVSLLDNDLGIEYPRRRSSNMDPALHHHQYYPTNGADADEMLEPPDGTDGTTAGLGGGSTEGEHGAHQQQLRTRDLLLSENERIRSEMETLTAALASMELKQNMAIMTESIRMQEEIQSLRAVCHGLRMQMHYVLLERQHQQQGPPPPPQGHPPTSPPKSAGSAAGSGGGGSNASASAVGVGGGGGPGPKGPSGSGRPLSMGTGMRPPYMNSIGRQETKL